MKMHFEFGRFLALVLLAYFQNGLLPVKGFGLVDVLDATRSAFLREDKSYIKTISTPVKEVVTRYTTVNKKIGSTGLSARRRLSSKGKIPLGLRKRVSTKVVKKKVTGSPLNKFLHAINQVEKGVMEAGAMRKGRAQSATRKVAHLRNIVKSATDSREYVFARHALGHLIYNTAIGRAGTSPRRLRRQATSASGSAISDIKNLLGPEKFAALMALDGGVTLAFAIDTTYSMIDEIDGALSIARDIVNTPRTYEVSYVLSPFNDPRTSPAHGPATFLPPEKKDEMIERLTGIRKKVQGGGDCPEYAIEGLQNIFTTPVALYSPIYLFTDAGPKDANEDSLNLLLESADFIATPINFFLSKSGCLNPKAIKTYQEIADATGGEVLRFGSNDRKLLRMNDYIKKSLVGGSPLPVEENSVSFGKRRKRAAPSTRNYDILVDDSVSVLTANVVTESKPIITLKNPSGVAQISGKTSLDNGALFVIKNPPSGVWKLVVQGPTSVNMVTAKGVSSNNIDFDFHFLITAKVGRRGDTEIVTNRPVLGSKMTKLVITVTASELTIQSSLKAIVTDRSLKRITTLNLLPFSKSSGMGRFKVTFPSPRSNFLLVLSGKTVGGKDFKRLSRGTIEPTTLITWVVSARKGMTLKAGDRLGTSLLVAIINYDASQRVKVKVVDKAGFIKPLVRTNMLGITGRMLLLPLKYVAPSSAKKGQVQKSLLLVESLKSKKQAKLLISLLIV